MVRWFARVPVLLALLVMVTGGSVVMSSGPAQAAPMIMSTAPTAVEGKCGIPADGGGVSGIEDLKYCEKVEIQEWHRKAVEDGRSVAQTGIAPGPGALGAVGASGRAAASGGSGFAKGALSWLGAAGIGIGTAYTVDGATGALVDGVMTAPEFWSNVWNWKCVSSAFICPEGEDGSVGLFDWLDRYALEEPGQEHPWLAYVGSVVEITGVTVDATTERIIDHESNCETFHHPPTYPEYSVWCERASGWLSPGWQDGTNNLPGVTMSFLCENMGTGTVYGVGPGELGWAASGANVGQLYKGLPIFAGSGAHTPTNRLDARVCGSSPDFEVIAAEVTNLGGCHVPKLPSNLLSHVCIPTTFLELGKGLSVDNLADLVQLDIETHCKDAATGTMAVGLAIGGVGDRMMPPAVCEPGSVLEEIRVNGSMLGTDLGAILGLDYSGLSDEVKKCVAESCILRVQINGKDCYYGLAGCATWWSNPDARCLLGHITMTKARCEVLRYAYVTPGGAVTDPANPYDPPVPVLGPGPAPVPWPPEVPLPIVEPIEFPPGYQPAPPPVVPEVPGSCPATGHPLEEGLSPAAANVWRCTVFEYPGFQLTSGLRPDAADWSDHKHGNAVDIAPWPSWSTPEGNAAGWDAAYWLTANSTELGVKYVIFDHWRWPSYQGEQRWVPYKHPSGLSGPSYDHENHLHVSVGSPVNDPRDDYGDDPTPRPDPEPAPGDPGPGPSPVPENPFPGTGENPAPQPGDPQDCWSTGWSWNPISWVYVPVSCSLQWAFVPADGALDTEIATRVQQLRSSPGGEWLAAPADVIAQVASIGDPALTGGSTSCQGPPLTMGLDVIGAEPATIYPFAACEGPMQIIAGFVRGAAHVSLYVAFIIAAMNMFTSGLGLGGGFFRGVPDIAPGNGPSDDGVTADGGGDISSERKQHWLNDWKGRA